ncbi:unnamed protein product [Pedinophyceae sp. YPF-701]|nr:unnamed protein product [Pedinophyceae sp. YPF-701]
MGLSPDEITMCRKAFAQFDADGSGTIDVSELRTALEALGQQPTEDELFNMIAQVDEDNSGQIEFREFLKVIESQKQANARKDDESEIVAAFVAMGGAADKSGSVSAARLKETIKEFGLTIDIEKMIRELDKDDSGLLEYPEFKAMLM